MNALKTIIDTVVGISLLLGIITILLYNMIYVIIDIKELLIEALEYKRKPMLGDKYKVITPTLEINSDKNEKSLVVLCEHLNTGKRLRIKNKLDKDFTFKDYLNLNIEIGDIVKFKDNNTFKIVKRR